MFFGGMTFIYSINYNTNFELIKPIKITAKPKNYEEKVLYSIACPDERNVRQCLGASGRMA
jgi:hypothetical protein